jgi:hypothetical protein
VKIFPGYIKIFVLVKSTFTYNFNGIPEIAQEMIRMVNNSCIKSKFSSFPETHLGLEGFGVVQHLQKFI